MRKFTILIFILAAASAPVTSQRKSIPERKVDPFSIKSGSTFSASSADPASTARVSGPDPSIASDIREAQSLLARHYVEGRALKAADLSRSAIDGMLRTLDPHSHFFTAAEWNEMLDEQRSGYTGVGATIANFERDGAIDTYVLSTFPGSPAARSGLRFGDRVVAINGEKMVGKMSEAVRDKIRGATGTIFRLTIERATTGRVETAEIRRNRVPQPSIPDAYILRPGVGYIDLSEGFNYTTYDEFDTAMRDLKRQGMKSLVLDLRGNTGGIVEQAVKVAERFLPAGAEIVTQRGRSRIDNRIWQSTNRGPETLPLVVLVDELSASASEIVAGAFQDDDRALIVGERTYGKGLVQSVLDLPGGTGLTLTTSRYLTPSGRSIQREYEGLDLYDYYNHRAAAKTYFEARTVTDRPVFGGDGILPDEVVPSEDMTVVQAALLDPIFFFARDIVAGRIAGSEFARPTKPGRQTQISYTEDKISRDVVSAFEQFAIKHGGGKLNLQTLSEERKFIELRLRYNLALAAFGTTRARQVLIENDAQVTRAVEALPRAAELARMAEKTRNQQK